MRRLVLWAGWFGLACILYSVAVGLQIRVPELPVLHQSIRVLFFHVPMWFAMLLLLLEAFLWSAWYWWRSEALDPFLHVDRLHTLLVVALWSGCLGMVTGMVWAKNTWGAWWHGDPKQNASLIALFLIGGFFLLEKVLPSHVRARLLSIYVVVVQLAVVWLVLVLPRLVPSLHPGAGGNPAFNAYDIDNTLRMVFYPAVVGWWLVARVFAHYLFVFRQRVAAEQVGG